MSGDKNLCLGQFTGFSLKTGNNNTLLGVNNSQFLVSGSLNIIIGENTNNGGNKIVAGSSNIFIGNTLNPPTSDPSNLLMIGNFIKGDLSNGSLGINTSADASAILDA